MQGSRPVDYTLLLARIEEYPRRVKCDPRERPASYVVTKMVPEETGRKEVGRRRDPQAYLLGGEVVCS